MKRLTQLERDALENLSALAQKAMRSNTTLRILGKLQEKGLIEFYPFEGKAFITGVGHAAIKVR